MTISIKTKDSVDGAEKVYTIFEATEVIITGAHGLTGKPITEWDEDGFIFKDTQEDSDFVEYETPTGRAKVYIGCKMK